MPSRREVLIGTAALAACGPGSEVRSARDVLAAGQPAAILVLALAPDRMLGWPRRPGAGALALLPHAADLPEHGALTGGGAPASLEAVAALRPKLILDYGDTDGDYREVAARLRDRVGAPYRLIDGSLSRTPAALATAGVLLGRQARGRQLAGEAKAILAQWSKPADTGPRFYYARGRDGLETGFAGSLAGEVLEGAGWRNVAVGGRNIGRVSREQVVDWDPEIIVTLDPAFARTAAADPLWHRRADGRARRLLLLPDLPFGWIDRPPSINRLLGCAWLGGGGLGGAGIDGDEAAAAAVANRFADLFYGRTPTAAQARTLVPRWIG